MPSRLFLKPQPESRPIAGSFVFSRSNAVNIPCQAGKGGGLYGLLVSSFVGLLVGWLWEKRGWDEGMDLGVASVLNMSLFPFCVIQITFRCQLRV
jgi:hypothetical protein